jgi:hypothetical protein
MGSVDAPVKGFGENTRNVDMTHEDRKSLSEPILNLSLNCGITESSGETNAGPFDKLRIFLRFGREPRYPPENC